MHSSSPVPAWSELGGAVVIVTGASGGIGHATIQLLLDAGALVAAVDLPGRQPEFPSLPSLLTIEADVTSADDWRRLVDRVIETWGRLDGLFNNAGIVGPSSSAVETDDAAFDEVIATDLKSVWLGMRACFPALAQSGHGAIVNTASIAALGASPMLIGYGAAKAAVANMTKTVAVEFARLNVRVNAICPGTTDTAMLRSLEELRGKSDMELGRSRLLSLVPLRRYADPTEIAHVALFLLGRRSSYVTGAVIPVDGGMTAL